MMAPTKNGNQSYTRDRVCVHQPIIFVMMAAAEAAITRTSMKQQQKKSQLNLWKIGNKKSHGKLVLSASQPVSQSFMVQLNRWKCSTVALLLSSAGPLGTIANVMQCNYVVPRDERNSIEYTLDCWPIIRLELITFSHFHGWWWLWNWSPVLLVAWNAKDWPPLFVVNDTCNDCIETLINCNKVHRSIENRQIFYSRR